MLAIKFFSFKAQEWESMLPYNSKIKKNNSFDQN